MKIFLKTYTNNTFLGFFLQILLILYYHLLGREWIVMTDSEWDEGRWAKQLLKKMKEFTFQNWENTSLKCSNYGELEWTGGHGSIR